MSDERLLELPLFLGMSISELNYLRDGGELPLVTMPKGTLMAKEDSRMDALVIVIEGSVRSVRAAYDRSYQVEEVLPSPLVIQPDCLFGLVQSYQATWYAASACTVMTVRKADVVSLLQSSTVFRINFINAVSTASQRKSAKIMHQQSAVITHRIIQFIANRCQYPAGYKLVRIKMSTLAREIGCSRLDVSVALHELEDKELLVMHRSFIEIPMMQLLLKYR